MSSSSNGRQIGDYSTIHVVVAAGVVTVSLNRPDVRNAFNAAMIADLTHAFEAIAQDDSIRAVLLCGNGKLFSAGADIEWMRRSLDYSPEENLQDALRMSTMFRAIATVPAPVICRVHGAALGGGMGLVAACDIAVAAEGTTFGFTEVKLGIIPAVISAVVLPKVGESWARALYVTGERFDTEHARRIGLVHWVCAEVELDRMIESKLAEVLSAGPHATRAAKAFASGATVLEPVEIERRAVSRIAEIRVSDEAQEGLRAFLEKRPPSWRSVE